MNTPKLPPGKRWMRVTNKAIVVPLTFGPSLPSLRVSVSSLPEDTPEGRELAVKLKVFCDAISRYEESLGGVGMPVTDIITADGRLTLTLSPIKPTGLEERLKTITDLLRELSREKPTTLAPNRILSITAEPRDVILLALAVLPPTEFEQAA